MAILKDNVLSGLVGGVILYKVGDKKIARSMPANVRNPKTIKQRSQRRKISLTSQFLKALKPFIRIGYQAPDCDNSSNEAAKYIHKHCFPKNQATVELNYATVLISRGEIKAPEEHSISIEGAFVIIRWKPSQPMDFTDPKDSVMIAIYGEGIKETKVTREIPAYVMLLSDIATRADGSCSIPIPVHINPLHVWMFFHNSNKVVEESKEKISDSVYLGRI